MSLIDSVIASKAKQSLPKVGTLNKFSIINFQLKPPAGEIATAFGLAMTEKGDCHVATLLKMTKTVRFEILFLRFEIVMIYDIVN